MIEQAPHMNPLLLHLAELLDIPPSHYEKATKRYRSLGDWLHRDGSQVAALDPTVHPQGSFRLGTVIRPLLREEEYDLDLVCALLKLGKDAVSQKDLKELLGQEIKAYAESNGLTAPAAEKRRCWRLDYADDVSFHMDILPSLPDDEVFKASLVGMGVPEELAEHAIAITDKEHPRFAEIQDEWPRSNPKGYAEWFERRMRSAAQARMEALVLEARYASVDDVPAFEWKTPLQRAIQLLKRHRDVMFKDDPECKPISIIITTLSAEAYESESDLYDALLAIARKIPGLVRSQLPRVPNPVNPAEDFADRWAEDPNLERNFWAWHAQVKADLGTLARAKALDDIKTIFQERFAVVPPDDNLSDLASRESGPEGGVLAGPAVQIKTAPKPWKAGE